MSVDYSCGIAYGWRVTQEERDQMVQNCDYKYEDEFIILDAYRDSSDYIFGVWLLRGNCDGYCAKIDFHSLFDNLPEHFVNEYIEMLQEMGCEWANPNNIRFSPHMYLVGIVT